MSNGEEIPVARQRKHEVARWLRARLGRDKRGGDVPERG
jgi:hypothetical protein